MLRRLVRERLVLVLPTPDASRRRVDVVAIVVVVAAAVMVMMMLDRMARERSDGAAPLFKVVLAQRSNVEHVALASVEGERSSPARGMYKRERDKETASWRRVRLKCVRQVSLCVQEANRFSTRTTG